MKAAIPRVAEMASRLRPAHLLFLVNFGIAKAVVYLIPLLLAALVSERLYGTIELGLAIGLQAGALLLGATLAGVTQLFLVRRERGFGVPLILLNFLPNAALLVAGAALWLAGASLEAVLIVAVIGATVLQNTASTWFRMHGERNRTAWADGASLLISGAGALLAVAVAGPDALGTASAFLMAATGVIAAGGGALLWRHRAAGTIQRLRRATILGLPMMVAGVFSIWIGVGGRILVGLVGAADLAAYSVAFRIAGLALGLHQLATTAMYPQLYASRVRSGDPLLAIFLAAVLAVSIGLAVAGPLIPDFIHFSALGRRGTELYRALVPVTVLHTFFWIGFALLQMRINRFGAAKASILPLISVTLLGIGIILLAAFTISNDVRFVAWLIAAHAAAYFLTANLILLRRRVPHVRTGLVGLAGGAVLCLIALAALR
jgi:O-antigen/teichoic acid export membrane protein